MAERAGRRRAVVAAGAAGLLVLATAQPAGAVTLTASGTRLTWSSAADTALDELQASGTGASITLTSTKPGAAVPPGCTSPAGSGTYTCSAAPPYAALELDTSTAADVVSASLLTGVPVTVSAGPGDDQVTGSPSPDVLAGGDGNDTVDGGSGPDIVDGDAGDDVLRGGPDGDTVRGGDGSDRIDGGPGPDLLEGDAGDDSIVGGAGADVITAGDGQDFVSAADGEPDLVDCGAGLDHVSADVSDQLVGCEFVTGLPVLAPVFRAKVRTAAGSHALALAAFTVTGLPVGTTLALTCQGRCPFHARTTTSKQPRADLAKLFKHKPLHPFTLHALIQHQGALGVVVELTLSARGRLSTDVEGCQASGSTLVVSCP